MAREVNTVLAQIIAEQRNIPELKAEEIVKSMRSANQYQVSFFVFTSCARDKTTDGWLRWALHKIVSRMHVQCMAYAMSLSCHAMHSAFTSYRGIEMGSLII
jgi:hypothetical protein